MSLTEERLKAVYGVFTKGWQFLKEILQEYPEFPQKPLTEEQWEAIIKRQAEKYEEAKELYKDEALFSLYRSLATAAVQYMAKEGGAYENKKN